MAIQNIVLLALVAGAFAGPLTYPSQTCASTCEESRHGYETGKTYDYDLATTVTTSIPGATEEQSTLKLTAIAHVEVLSPCDLALRLEEVLLQEGEGNVERVWDFKRGLQEKTLRFSLTDGRIGEVCPEETEPTWALNIKKAILSSLQNTMSDYQTSTTTTETDVVGECPVSYEPVGSTWSGYTVKKTKDLLACDQPSHAKTIFQTMSYKVPSKVQSLPLLKSTHECVQELTTEGRLTKSTCTERHIFRPFSREESGATTLITHSLVFKSQSSGVRTPNQMITRRDDLQFEAIPDLETQEGTQREVMETLQKICEVTQQGIRPEVPGLFGDLVKGMRRLDMATLNNVARRASRVCDKAEAFFRDAVPTLGTSAAMGLMRDLIRNGQASENEADMWLTSLAFIPKPDTDMLVEVKPLLEIDAIRRKSYLAVSTMVSGYCRQNPECERERAVRDIISVFQANLGRDCSGDRTVVLMALKALGNTGHASQVTSILNQCIANEAASMEVRVAAVAAMRRMDCIADMTTLLDTFRSSYTDSELRINAYLALMRCPTQEVMNAVQRVLESEEINQVGSFIWTHLTNLQETVSPMKQEIRAILMNEKLKKEFDLDKRKFSRNIEWSAFSEAINTGVAVESNLIWSTQSFVPRSAMVNLTVDLFGKSINLVEVGGRIQGLDAILESMFADKQEGSSKTNNRINNLDNSFRRRETDPQGSYYIRVFGNEIRYEDFVGFDTESIKEKLNYLQWLIELAKEHDFDFTKSIMFLESEMQIPTVAGMPLVLSVDGTATMDLKIKGKMDLRSIASSPSGMDITGTVRPTAAIQVNGKMGVDAFVARTGLKMTNTFHTSTVADGSITLRDGKIFNLDINMPTERMEVFSAQSKFFITYRGQEKEQTMPSEGRFEYQRCVGGSMIKAFGVEMCAELSLPKLTRPDGPWFPLTGPVTAALTLNKRDSFTKYHMEARLVNDRASSTNEMIFSFNTPGSRFDREFTANFALNKAEKAVRADLRSPWKKIGMTGSMVNNADLKRLTGQVTIDDSAQYSLTTELQISDGKYATRYTPNIELSIPGKAPYKLSGSVTYREGKKADLDITIDNVFEEPATLKGLIRKIEKNDQTRVESEIEVRLMSFKGQMSGYVDSTYTKDEIKADTQLTVKYRTDNGPQSISLNNQFQMQTATERKAIVMTGAVQTTLYPEYDSDYSIQLYSEDKEAGLNLDMGLTKDKPKRIVVVLQGKMDVAPSYRNALVQGLAQLTIVEREWAMKLEHTHNPSELKTIWSGRQDRSEANMEVTLKRESQNPLRLSAEATLVYPGREVHYVHSLVQEGRIYNHDLTVTVDQYDTVTLTSVYKMGRRHELSADLNVHQMQPLHIEGFVQPIMENFAAEAKTTYGRQSYSTEWQWQHNGNSMNFNNKASWKLFINRDQFGLDSEVSMQDANKVTLNIESKWDVNSQGMRKAGVSGTYVISKTTPSIQTRVQWWPNRFVDGSLDLKIDENNFWSSTRNLEGNMRFGSSYSEDMAAAFKYERQPATVDLTGEFSLSPSQKFDGVFNLRKINGWRNANMLLTLNTPFNQASRIRSQTTYNLEGQTLTASGQASWNDNQITFETTSTMNLPRHDIDMTIKGTTPFRGYENFNLVVKHNDAGRTCKSELKLDVGSRQLVGIDFSMDHDRNGYFITNAGTLTVTLPIQGYTTNKLTWNHDNNAREVNSRFVLELENDRNVFDLEVKNRKIFSLKANVQSPYMRNVRVNLEHQADRREWIYKTTGSAQYGRDTYAIDNDFSMLAKSFTLKSKITTPYRNWEETTIDLSNVMEGNTFTANNQFTSGSGSYGISGNFVNNGMPTFSTQIRLLCPHSGEVTLNAANEKQLNIWVSSLRATYSGDKTVSVETKLGLDDMKKFSIDITSPYEAMQEASLDIEHRGEPTKFDTKFTVAHSMLRGRIEGELNVDVSDINDIKVKLTGQTPFRKASSVRSIFSHKTSGSLYKTDFSVELPANKIVASNTLRITNSQNFNTVTSLEYATGKKIELELNVDVERNVAINAIFRSPLTGEQSATLNHQGPWNNFQTSLTISPRQSETINSNAQFSLRGNNVNGLFKISTPYEALQTLEVTLNHRGDIFSFENDVAANYNGKRLSGNSRFTLDDRGFRGEVNANTPFRNYRNLALVFNHNGDPTNFNSKYELTYDNQKITLIADYNFNYRGVTGRFELTTPYRQLSTASLNFEHNGDVTDFRNTGTVGYNGKQYSGESTFSLRGNSASGSAKVRLPEEYTVEFNHNGNIMDFNNNAAVRYNGQAMTGRSSFKLLDGNLETSIAAETPFPGYSNMGVTYTHKGSLSNFECELNVKLEDKTITARQAFTLQYRSVVHTINVQTPFPGYSNLAYSLNHQSGRGRLSQELTLSKEEARIEVRDNFRMTPNKVSGSLNINTPFDVVRDAALSFFHNMDSYNFNNELTASLNRQTIKGKSSYSLAGSSAEGRVEIETPFNGYRTAALTFKHKGPWQRFNNEMTMSLENNVITNVNSFSFDGSMLTADFKVETPFTAASLIRFQLRHNGASPTFENEITATYNNYIIESRNNLAVVQNRIEGNFNINTPFNGCQTMSVSILHDGHWGDFNCEYSASLEDKKITIKNKFLWDNDQVEETFTVDTPFSGYSTMGINLKHTGYAKNFNNEISATLEGRTITGRTSFSLTGSKMDLSTSITTPFSGYSTMGFNLKHTGYATNFNNDISATLEGRTITGRTSFSLTGSKMDLSTSISTPFRKIRNIVLTVSHDGPLKNFRNEATLQYNGERYTANTEFALRTEYLKVIASVQIPEVYGFNFEHQGPWTGFNNNLILTIAGEPHTATSSFTYGDKIEGNVNVNTPKMPMTLRFNHEGQMTNFKQDSSLDIAGKAYSHSCEFSMQPRKINGMIQLNTPHRIARSLGAKFDHTGKWNNFENLLILERNGDRIRANSQLAVNNKRTKGEITIKLPEEYSIEFIQKGSSDDLAAIVKMNVGGDKSQANIDFKNKANVLEGSVSIRTPYKGYKNMGADFSFKNKKVMTVTGSLKTPFNAFDNFAMEITHSGDLREFTTSGKVESPFRFARVTMFEVNHKGRLANFEERAFVDVDQKRVSGNVSFRKSNAGLQASANVETPFEIFRTGSLSLSHTGSLTDFNTNANAEYNGQRIESTATFKKADSIEASASLTTPYDAVRTATFNLNHQGPMNAFTTTTNMGLNGQEIRAVLTANKQGNVIESTGTLSTPFYSLRNGNFRFSHRGSYNDFTTGGEVQYDGQKIDGELVFKLAPEIMTTARLSTPYQAFRQFNFNLNHRGNMMDFATTASGDVNGQRINSFVAFKKDDRSVESSASITTPFETFPELAYTYNHIMQRRSIRSTATLTLPCEVHKNYRGEFQADGTLDNFRSTFKVNTPFEALPEATATVSHRGNLQDLTTAGSLEFSGQRIESEVTLKNNDNLQQATLKISSPYRKLRNLNIVLDNQRRGAEMVGRVEATYNSQKHVDSDYTMNVYDFSSAVLNMRAPINMEIRGKNEVESKELNINVPRTVALTSSFDKDSEKFTHVTRLQLGDDATQVISYRAEGSKAYRNRQAIYDGRFVLNSKYGDFETTMSHKISPTPRYTTEIQIQSLRLNSDIALMENPNFQATFTMGHPSFTKDVVFGVEGSMGDSYNGKINLEYADQRFEFVGKVADESPSTQDTRYVAEAHLTHPASYLDVQFSSQLTNNDEKMGGNMEVKYMMTRDRQLKSNALRAEINKLRQELNMELNTPVKRVSMSGRRVEEAKGQHFTVVGNVDDRDMSADVQLNTQEPGFDINLQLDRNNKVIVSGKYAEPASLQLEAYREENGRRVRESEVSVTVNSDNMINARAFLNPSAYDDMRRLFGFDLGLDQLIDDVSRSLREEMRYKRAYLARAFQPIKETWSTLTEPIAQVFNQMYNRNDYYVATVVDAVSYYTTIINGKLADLKNKYGDHLARKFYEMREMYYASYYNFKSFMTEVVTPNLVNAYTKTMETVEYIQNHPMVARFLNWMESLQLEEYYAKLRDTVISLVKQYNALLDSFNEYWEKFQDIPGMSYLIDRIRDVINSIRWIYDASELDELIQTWMRELRAHGWRAIKNWWQSKNDMFDAQYTRWEPEQGDYEVQIKMPVSWSDLTSMPSFSISKYWEQLMDTVSRILPDINFSFGNSWSFWDAFYTYKPSTWNPVDWIPPFKTHATMSGSQHFMTFDKKFFEFAGECSYLLARDFIDGKFSVMVNYDNVDGIMTKKSITVFSGDKEIEIMPDFTIMVDGQKSEMPVSCEKTVIRRIGNVVQIDNEHGLNITCDLPHDRCTVQVTGWYFGKTGGLLGTYDNEPATDFQSSDRSHSPTVEGFAQSWSLGRRCRAVNAATQVSPNSASSEYRMCSRYFVEDTSPFRMCFAQIKPEAFQSMCVNEVSKSQDKEAAVCKITSFYVEECKMAYIPLRMPRDCVKCTAADGSIMQEGETKTIQDKEVPKAADVVFVVSHKSCNREVLGRLGDIVDQMERNFRQAGIRDMRFGLVGYGLPGMLNLPHSHTLEGELFNAGNKFSMALSSFEITNENTDEDSMAALRFAARYPFRPGVSKSLVLVPCDSCQEREVSYPDIQRLLLDRDIRMHLLLQHDFQLRTSAPKTAFIFGVDREGLFTPRQVSDEELTGDKALRQQVLMPKDLCAALSQESDGSIFSVKQLLEARTVVQKKFLDVLTRLTAKKGAPTDCQICECTADATGVGMTVCRSCSPAEPINRSWFEYGDSFFEDENQSSEEEARPTKPRPNKEAKRGRKQARRLRNLNVEQQ